MVGDDDAHVVDDCSTRGALDAEGGQPRVALVAEDSHCLHALDELDGLGELVEECIKLEEELDDACELEIVVLEFLREVLPLVHGLVGLCRQWLDSSRVELVAPQELECHGVVVLDVVSRHLVQVGGDAHVLPLHVGVVVAVLVLAQRPLEFDVVGALESRCRVGD